MQSLAMSTATRSAIPGVFTRRERRATTSRMDRMRSQRSAVTAASSSSARADDAETDAPAWARNDLEVFASRVRAWERGRGGVALRALEERAGARGLDADALLCCARVGVENARTMSRSEIARVGETGERWRRRVGAKLRSAEASLMGGDDAGSEPRAAARAVAAKVADATKDLERASRRFMHEATVEECEFGDAGERMATPSGSGEIPEKWRMACVNAGAYLEYAGAVLTFDEWKYARTVFAAVVEVVDGKTTSDALVGDDAVWREMKGMIDDSTIRPRRLSQTRNNERYHEAQEELDEAKKEWKEATQAYKEARRRIKRARQKVHSTRKAVRIEYR
jgi:hypothetical protein